MDSLGSTKHLWKKINLYNLSQELEAEGLLLHSLY